MNNLSDIKILKRLVVVNSLICTLMLSAVSVYASQKHTVSLNQHMYDAAQVLPGDTIYLE